jgi:hypothetical protein
VAKRFGMDGGLDRAGHGGFCAVRHWDFVITQRDITLCRLETALKFCVHQPG